jgi:hypothetical protein
MLSTVTGNSKDTCPNAQAPIKAEGLDTDADEILATGVVIQLVRTIVSLNESSPVELQKHLGFVYASPPIIEHIAKLPITFTRCGDKVTPNPS